MNYATVQDIMTLKRPLSAAEQARAEALIPLVSDTIRYEAQKVGKNFDLMLNISELGTQYDYFVGDGEETDFVLNNTPVETLFVIVGGEPVEYTIDGATVKFTEAPADGAEINIAYSYKILASIAKTVVADVVMRELNTPAAQIPAIQYSEAAGGVSQSYTIPNSSGRIGLWPSDLKLLGLRKQRIGSIDMLTEY